MQSLPGQPCPEQKTIQKETDEETFPGDKTNGTGASQSKSSGGCPDQSAPVLQLHGGQGHRISRWLGKNEIKAHGEVPGRMYKAQGLFGSSEYGFWDKLWILVFLLSKGYQGDGSGI